MLRLTFVLLVALPALLAMKKCIRPPIAPLNEEFFRGHDFKVAMHSDCDNCDEGLNEKAFESMTGDTVSKEICWSIEGIRGDMSAFKMPTTCRYIPPRVSEQVCEFTARITPWYKYGFHGTHTDNSTYFAGSSCIFGKENFWIIFVKNDSDIDQKTRESIVDDFEKWGFKKNNIAVEGRSPVVFQKTTRVAC